MLTAICISLFLYSFTRLFYSFSSVLIDEKEVKVSESQEFILPAVLFVNRIQSGFKASTRIICFIQFQYRKYLGRSFKRSKGAANKSFLESSCRKLSLSIR